VGVANFFLGQSSGRGKLFFGSKNGRGKHFFGSIEGIDETNTFQLTGVKVSVANFFWVNR